MADLFSLAVPLLAVVVTMGATFGYMFFVRGRAMASVPSYQAGALAARLGMHIERGHPGFNLFVTGVGSLADQHFDVLLRGERHGVPIELVYFRHNTTDERFELLTATTHFTMTRRWEGRLTARTHASFGHFEVSLRHPNSYNRVAPFFDAPLQEVPTGHPAVDAALRLRTDNPGLAPHLGALLAPLTTLQYVHVVGHPGQVSFLMSHADVGKGHEMIGVGYALHDAERIYDVLTRIVLTAEGRA